MPFFSSKTNFVSSENFTCRFIVFTCLWRRDKLSNTKTKMNMQKSCFGNGQFIQVLFFLTYNKPLDITNQGFILRHSTKVHIKDQKRTLKLQTT